MSNARLTISLAALAANWRRMAALAPDASTGAAVKADAYGLGAERIAPTLHAAGCRDFFVAQAQEGADLRPLLPGANIFVLGGLTDGDAGLCAAHGLIPVLNHMGDVEAWRPHAALPCALNFDTGLNRLGFEPGHTELALQAAAGLNVVLVMSHFACADEPGHPMNALQLVCFEAIRRRFPRVRASMSNSAGVQLGRAAHFDLTRPGIALYGGESVNDAPNIAEPVATLQARILQIRRAQKGETVGYGATAALTRDSRIAIAGIGYADGVHRAASGSGVAMRGLRPGASGWLFGHVIPMLGRVSMDLAAFDVTDAPDVVLEKAGWIEIFGRNIALDEFARAAGTIGYEVLTGIGRRVERVYG